MNRYLSNLGIRWRGRKNREREDSIFAGLQPDRQSSGGD